MSTEKGGLLLPLRLQGLLPSREEPGKVGALLISTLRPQRAFLIPLEEEEVPVLAFEDERLFPCCQPSVWDFLPFFLELGEISLLRVVLNFRYPDGGLGTTLYLYKETSNVNVLVQTGKVEGLYLAKRLLRGKVEGFEALLEEYEIPFPVSNDDSQYLEKRVDNDEKEIDEKTLNRQNEHQQQERKGGDQITKGNDE